MSKEKRFSRFLSRFLGFLYVPRCPGCQALLPTDGSVLCPKCEARYEMEKEKRCPDCQEAVCRCRCSEELLERYGIRTLYKSFFYYARDGEAVQNRMLYRLKHRADAPLCHRLASELAASIEAAVSEEPSRILLTYLPRTPKGIAKYGFDHMELLTREVAALLGCEWEPLLSRRGGREQKHLTRTARVANMKETLYPKSERDLTGRRVILLDDICTSGASLAAAADLLHKQGARRIRAAVLGFTLRGYHGEEHFE